MRCQHTHNTTYYTNSGKDRILNICRTYKSPFPLFLYYISIKKSVGIGILGLLVEWLKRQFTFENPQFPSESSQKCNSFCVSSFCKNCNNFFASILFFSDRNTCSSSLMTQKQSSQILPLLSHPTLCRIKLSRGALYLLKMCTASDAAMRMMLSKSLSLITVAWFQSTLPQ